MRARGGVSFGRDQELIDATRACDRPAPCPTTLPGPWRRYATLAAGSVLFAAGVFGFIVLCFVVM